MTNHTIVLTDEQIATIHALVIAELNTADDDKAEVLDDILEVLNTSQTTYAQLFLGDAPLDTRQPEDFCMDDAEWFDFCDLNGTRFEVLSDPEALYIDVRSEVNGREFHGISREEFIIDGDS